MNNIICMSKVGEDGERETDSAQTSRAFLRSFPIFAQAVIKSWGGASTVSVLHFLCYTYGKN